MAEGHPPAAVSERQQLTVEQFHITIPEEHIERFGEDPAGYLHAVLSELDLFPVNSVRFVGVAPAKGKGKGKDGGSDGGSDHTCWHVIKPDAEWSNTICF
jgi:hypothetical protein